ncbi:hypothetical protein F2Q68_00037554 [Brassica cretica]|uniref:Uncharacterized protein n=1 Tax=Brassica cretica TaxID=69181 RepID=A0A8S9H2D3_BRACR|nr:hypothetical protein F2Q68_00037554 [Brassica cretica]
MVEPGRRSVSEITAVPRLSIAVHGDYSGSTASTALEMERRRRLWLPIARNTAQCLPGYRSNHVHLEVIVMTASNCCE